MIIHGGAYVSGDYYKLENLGKTLFEAGYLPVLVNYRLATLHILPVIVAIGLCVMLKVLGLSLGVVLGIVFATVGAAVLTPQVKWSTLVYDVENALDWTRANIHKYGGDPDSIYLLGHSAGAHLAALVGNRKSDAVSGVIGVSGIYSQSRMREQMMGVLFDMDIFESDRNGYPIHLVGPDSPPHLLINAEADPNFKRQTRDYYLVLKRYGVSVNTYIVENTDHFSVIKRWTPDSDVMRRIRSFTTPCLR